MITIKTNPTIYVLHDEQNDTVDDCSIGSYIIMTFDDEFVIFYKDYKFEVVRGFYYLEDAINFLFQFITLLK